MIKTPRLDRRLQIQRHGTVDDGYGNEVSGPFAALDPDLTVWAQVKPRGPGSEPVLASRLTGVVLYDVVIRYSEAAKGVKASDRAVDANSGEIFNVRHEPVDPDNDRNWLAFTAETGSASG